MSKQVDNYVASMEFDNSKFEKNVSTTMSTLDKLKQKLNLDGASKGLEDINAAAGKVNMSGLSGAVETVKASFSALDVVAVTALANITNKAINAGEQLVKSLSVDQITAGWQKFSDKTTSVATLVAQGNALEDVNDQLDRLNWFTDETSYNFTDMVSNISKFTATGKGLEESVTAMEGIANWAALSGQNASTASRAMYQLSQAMGAGYMRLEDYKSIQNASMDTEEFRQKCLDAAVSLGTLKDNGDGTYQSLVEGASSSSFNISQFTQHLTDGLWFTSDVMMSVFTEYSSAVSGIYEATESTGKLASEVINEVHDKADELKTDLMTDEEAIDAAIKELGYTFEDGTLMFDSFGLKAFEAAQKARTFTDAIDSVKDAVSTGWMNTFELIFGDAEEATELWTDLANAMWDVFAAGGEARNEMLQGWKDLGGRDDLIESFWNVWDGVASIIAPIKEAFRDIFPAMTSERLAEITAKIKDLTSKFKLSDDQATKLKSAFKGLFSVLDIGLTAVKALVKGAGELISKFKGVAGGLLSGSASIGDFLSNLRNSAKETNFFGNAVDKVVGFLTNVITKIKEFGQSLKDGLESPDFSSTLGFFKGLWGIITKVGSAIAKTFGSIGSTISEALGKGDIFEVLNSGLIAGILLGINKFTSGLKDAVDNAGGFVENIKGILDDVRGCFQAYQEQLKAGALLKIAAAIAILAASLFVLSMIDADSLGTAIGAITVLFAELVGSMALMNKLGGKSSLFDTTAVKMVAMSVSILILAAALKSLSGLSWEQMAVGLVAVSALLWELVAVSIVMSKTGTKMVKGSLGLIALAVAIKILASACKDFAAMDWEDIGKGLTAIGILLLEISIFEVIAGKAKHVVSTGVSMLLIAASMKIVVSVLSDLAAMDWNGIGKGLTAMGVALGEMAIAMRLMPNGSMFKAAGLVLAAASLKILTNVMSDFAGMEWTGIGKGLAAMGVALAELAIGLNLMKGTLAGAAALLVAAVALAVVVPVMTALGNLSWEQIAKGLVTLAGAFAVIGVAGLLLQPLITPILLLSAAFVLLGVGMVGIGAGLLLVSAGISALAVALSAGAASIIAALTVIVTGILELVPTIARIIGEGIVELAKVIGEYTPQLADSFLKLLLGVLQSLAENAPQITDALFELLIGIINSLATHTPALIEALANLFANVFVGLVDALKSMGLNSIRDGLDIALGLSALMLAMSVALKVAGSISIGSAIKGVIALTAMAIPMLAFVGVLALASGIDNAMNNALALAVLAGTCTVMLGVLTIIGLAWPAAAAGIIALTAMAIPMLAFVGILALMNAVDNAMANALLLGMFMSIMADVLVKVAVVAPLAAIGVAAMGGLTLLMGAIGTMAVAVGALMETFPSIQSFLDTGLPVLEKLAGSIGTMIGNFVGNLGEALSDSLVKIGDDIAEFMDKLATASDNASGIKGESFDGVKQLMVVMAEIGGTSILTGITDLFSTFLSGESSMDKFVSDAKTFFEGMKEAMAPLDGVTFNEQGMNTIITAAERLSDLRSSLEPIGGVMDWFSGRDDLGSFGANIGQFVSSMVTAFDSLNGVTLNTDAMNSVIGAATNLADLQSSLEPIGGVVTWFTGRDDLGTFGTNIGQFVSSMVTAFSSLTDATLNVEAMNSIIGAATSLANLQNSLEPIGGVVTWFTGRDDLGTFGFNVGAFICSMKTAFSSLDGAELNTEGMESIISAATSLADLQTSLEPIGGVITWFTGRDDLGTFGANVNNFITSMITAFNSLDGVELNAEAMEVIISASTSLAGLQSSLESIGGVVTWFTGRDDLGTFGTNAASFITSMKTAMASLDGVTLNEEAMSSVINAASKLSDLQSKLEPMGGVVSWFTGRSDLGTFGTNIGLFADAMGKLKTGIGENGISEEVVASVINAGNAIIELQKALPEEGWFDGKMNLSEFSDYVTDFATAMSTFSSKATEIESGAISTVIDTAYRIKRLIESLVDLDTSGVDAFTGIGSGGIGADGPAYDIACAIAKFGEKVADIDTEAVTVAVTAAKKLKTLISSLVGLDTSGIENFKPGEIGEQMKSYGEKVAGIDTGIVSSSITLANRLKNFISGLAGLDTSGITNFKPESIGSALKAYGDSISGTNIGAISSSITAANRLKNFISSLAGLDSSGVGSFKTAVDQLATVNIAGLVKAFSGASAKLQSAGADMIDGLIKGMQSKLSDVTAVSTKITTSAQKVTTSKASTFATAGGTLATKLASGFSSKKNVVNSAVSACLSSAATKIRDKYTAFYNAGSYLVTGFSNGISDNSYKAAAKAKAMAEAAEKAAREALKINSPSKVFKEIGSGVPEGFALGISMLGGKVKQSVNDMASTAINATRSAMSTVLDALNEDMDAQPTIRPVVDLSDVKTGINAIDGLFTSTQSVGVQSNLGAVNLAMSRRLQNENEVVSAIRDLRKDVSNMGNNTTYTINGITYDDGSNISDAVKAIVRAARIERRV